MTKAVDEDRLTKAVVAALPGQHLEIWSKVREEQPEVHPAMVWRALINSGVARLDLATRIWSKKD